MDHADRVPRDVAFELLFAITDGFSRQRQLGSGASGKVYRGVYMNGEEVAVKVLQDLPGVDEELFTNEFNKLATLQHPNIVRLIGFCHETRKKYVKHNGRYIMADEIKRALCLEYLCNGSLENYISDGYDEKDWPTCYGIIKGICMGLEYLHEGQESPIYHLDLKPGNILLDKNMIPKIADFGLSRLFGGETTWITRSSIGTPGYLPPEYIERHIISNKLDIFSLGVIVIKIIAGRSGYTESAEMSAGRFIQQVHTKWIKRLRNHGDSKQLRRCITVALSCVAADRNRRPSIRLIVEKLIGSEKAESNTCNICNAPCSSCLHISIAPAESGICNICNAPCSSCLHISIAPVNVI